MTYVKKSVKNNYKIAHTLNQEGLDVELIGKVLNKKPERIKFWLRFDTYEDMQNYSKEHAPKRIKMVKVEPSVEMYADDFKDSKHQEIIDRLDEIFYILNNRLEV